MASKPSIPKGTRDFSPVEVSKRNYIIGVMRRHFENYGFQPIETPSFENSETLMGKYGEEGDRLIFKILNSGEFFKKFNETLFKIIYTAVHYHHTAAVSNEKNESFNHQEYKDTFLNKLGLYLKDLNNNQEEKISEDVLTDVFYLLIRHCNKTDDTIKDFIKKSKEELEKVVILIYGDFFVSLKSKYLTSYISEKALRYDLTVPFARYVVQHQNEIEFPFKRYQIQPVWRADRPQKGRFREFYQCDADVVGSTSLWQEVELVQLYDSIFAELGLDGVTIKINNRKILTGIAQVIGASDKLIDFTVALDKLDKIGAEGVKKEMLEKGISDDAILKVQPLFNFTGTIQQKIEKLSVLLSDSKEGMEGIQELQFICDNVIKLGLQKAILDLDVTLARGLNYYTGAIFEVEAPKGVAMGSIGGGGRYDDLTGIFDSKSKMSGVGISFGLDRIYLVLEELNLFPPTVITSTKVLFLNLGASQEFEAMQVIQKLRMRDIKSEMYPDAVKIDKQFKHAEKRAIPFVVKEISNGQFTLKNLLTGEQMHVDFDGLLKQL